MRSAASPDLAWGWAEIGADGPSAAGRRAALEALAQLGPGLALAYEGARPIAIGGDGIAVSVSHGRRRAVAVAGRVARLGVDLCEHDREPRIREIASRFLSATECALIDDDRSSRSSRSSRSGHSAAAVWAAKEAGLKALGLGLDGIFDGCPVQLGSLAPPRYDAPVDLILQLDERDGCALALAYTPPSTTTVAPFM